MTMMFISANQQAQQDGNTGANEARRIKERESLVKTAWRTHVFTEDTNPSASLLAARTGLPEHYIVFICGTVGYTLA